MSDHSVATLDVTSNLGDPRPTQTLPRSFIMFSEFCSQYHLLKNMSTYLSITDIIALTRTHMRLSNVYGVLLGSRRNVDKTLRRFVSDPRGFRSQMAKHDALVHGSLPLQFFKGVVWDESDMDVVMQDGNGVEAFGNYLINAEGYELHDTSQGGDYEDSEFKEVKKYTKWELEGAEKKQKKVQIVSSEEKPVSVILRAHTTVVVNFFSWNKAYAVYSMLTMVDQKGYLLRSPHHKRREFRKSVTKYTRRGWKFRGLDWPAKSRFSNLPVHNSRRIGDRLSWIIPFNTDCVEQSKTPDHVLEYADFTIRTDPIRRGTLKYFLVEFSQYTAAGLKYSYTFGHKRWMTYLESKLAAKTHENPRRDSSGNVRPA